MSIIIRTISFLCSIVLICILLCYLVSISMSCSRACFITCPPVRTSARSDRCWDASIAISNRRVFLLVLSWLSLLLLVLVVVVMAVAVRYNSYKHQHLDNAPIVGSFQGESTNTYYLMCIMQCTERGKDVGSLVVSAGRLF